MHIICSTNLVVIIYYVIHLKTFTELIPVFLILGVVLPNPFFCYTKAILCIFAQYMQNLYK